MPRTLADFAEHPPEIVGGVAEVGTGSTNSRNWKRECRPSKVSKGPNSSTQCGVDQESEVAVCRGAMVEVSCWEVTCLYRLSEARGGRRTLGLLLVASDDMGPFAVDRPVEAARGRCCCEGSDQDQSAAAASCRCSSSSVVGAKVSKSGKSAGVG